MNDLKKYIDNILSDETKSVDERIEEVMALRDRSEETEKSERLAKDRIIFQSLFEMLNELPGNERDVEKIQLLTLLAETMVGQRDYRHLKYVSEETLDILRDEQIEWDILEQAIPRIADALEYSYYFHDLYEILLRYMRKAIAEGVELSDIEDEAEMVVRLKILITDYYDNYLFDDKIRKALAEIFSSEKLIDIISRPDPGHLRRDPVEYTDKWEEIIYDAEEELDRRFANHRKGMGFCFMYWNAKQDLLKEKYGIEWRSPSQMNPRVMFD
ncbi:MAG: hypothetical protein K2K81_09990 [Muribaculaceae bacterium]|nr:hypothetical protein [Muribaculaceae bacterium]